ncbi:M28 family peptidase [Longitalea arenae]|uniref:M28 family peptidase n=1 Tax=Longitalea arenae TaxID=2812558 RepID=UPI0019682C8B|nr:M28 family peptidase [Longitalea arenae]
MLNLFLSWVKKLAMAATACMVTVASAIVLTGCPAGGEHKKKNAGKANVLINIDSASLINYLAYLSSAKMAGRETGTPGNQLARDYIVNVFDSLQIGKVSNTYLQSFPVGNDGHQGNNIIGLIKGHQFENNYIVITAHYDHLGTRNGNIYYGADDNASGTAALLAMARYFKQYPPKHSILFVAFDAEEKGLLGSKYFITHAPVPISAMAANVNMDMVSRNDSNEIYASGTRHYPFLKKYVDSIRPYSPVNVLFGHDGEKAGMHDWTNQSDHFPFHQNQIPYLYFGVEDHADYHRPGDTFDKVNKSFYYRVCTMITGVASLLDRPDILQ